MIFVLNEYTLSGTTLVGNVHNTGIEATNFDKAKELLKDKLIKNENICISIKEDSEEKFSYLITNFIFPIMGTLANKELEYI